MLRAGARVSSAETATRATTSGERSPDRRALLVAAFSLIVWVGWEVFRDDAGMFGTLTPGMYTDHVSHLSAARLFPRLGHDLWRRPVRALLPLATEAQQDRLPPDVQPNRGWTDGVFVVPGWPPDKPAVLSWAHVSRPYPPGDLLLVAPAALAFHFTPLSASAAYRLVIVLFLVYAHVSLFFVLRAFFAERGRGVVGLLAVVLTCSTALQWTLEGFYDFAAVGPLVLCAAHLAGRRGLAALVWYSASVFLHFRVLLFAPWAVAAAWLVVRDRVWRGGSGRTLAALAASAVLSLASLYAFALNWPGMKDFPADNPVGLWAHSLRDPAVVTFILVWALGIAVLAGARAWLDAAVGAWFVVLLLATRQVFPWHALIPLAWLAAPASVADGGSEGRVALVRDARVALLLFTSAQVYGTSLLPTWLSRAF
jgi:hypothetical protein